MHQLLHEKAKKVSAQYKSAERDLIEILSEIDLKKAYLELGYASLFRYAVGYLGLSEAETYRFTQVTRKSYEVPELKTAIGDGLLTVSKASRIAPVITSLNQSVWIEKAATLTQRELELAVAVENPSACRKESIKVITPERLELRLTLSKGIESQLRRAQEIFRTKSLEETIEKLIHFALERKDPVKKAERNSARKQLQKPTSVKGRNWGPQLARNAALYGIVSSANFYRQYELIQLMDSVPAAF